MRVSEIFHSIQGEGPAMGKPATFIRLAGCNLSCRGCDTRTKSYEEMSIPTIVKMIRGRRAIITGGEPTQQMKELQALINHLHRQDIEIHIESNGTAILAEDTLEMLHFAVISPKRGSQCDLGYWSKKANVHLKFVLGPEPWCWPPNILRKILPALRIER
jgi:7-carboxy-7-deazaguanine synthase